jgi:hypothetical protein
MGHVSLLLSFLDTSGMLSNRRLRKYSFQRCARRMPLAAVRVFLAWPLLWLPFDKRGKGVLKTLDKQHQRKSEQEKKGQAKQE